MADSSTSTPASPDLLSALPAELQCKIYSYAVAEGEVNVFETCRAISTHAASVLSRCKSFPSYASLPILVLHPTLRDVFEERE